MNRKRSEYLSARELELNRREFLASISLALAACGGPDQEQGANGRGGDAGSAGSGAGAAGRVGTGGAGTGGAGGSPQTSGTSGTGGSSSSGAGGAAGAGETDAAIDAGAKDARADATTVESGAGGPLIERIGFGSCCRTMLSQAFWPRIAAQHPQVYLPLGDNAYLDSGERYSDLAAIKGFTDLMARTIVMPIWDDHDYGDDNGGLENPQKGQYKQMFIDFFTMMGAPIPQARPQRHANHHPPVLGPPGKEGQFIMLERRSDVVVG